MLVLTRKPGERIQIGDSIWVEVRRVAGNRVTLAVDAPKHVHILRGELERFTSDFAEAGSRNAEPRRVEQYRISRNTTASNRLQTASV